MQRKRERSSSAARPVSPPPAPETVCFITSKETMLQQEHAHPEMNMLPSLRTALKEDPSLIVICFPNAGADLEKTDNVMEELAAELENLHAHGQAKSLFGKGCVKGLIHFHFQPAFSEYTLDPKPAMLLCGRSLAVVAASWPTMPNPARERVLHAYVREALLVASCSGALNMESAQAIDNLGDSCHCKTVHIDHVHDGDASSCFFLPEQVFACRNWKWWDFHNESQVSTVQVGQTNITIVTSTLPPRPSVVLTRGRRTGAGRQGQY